MPQYYKELFFLAFKFYYTGCIVASIIFLIRILTDQRFVQGAIDILEPVKNNPLTSLVILYGIFKMISLSWISVIRYLSKIRFGEGDNN